MTAGAVLATENNTSLLLSTTETTGAFFGAGDVAWLIWRDALSTALSCLRNGCSLASTDCTMLGPSFSRCDKAGANITIPRISADTVVTTTISDAAPEGI